MAALKSTYYSSLSLLCLLLAPTTTTAQYLNTQLSEVISYKSERFTECTNFISTCQPTVSSCASVVCAQCTDLGAKPLNSCCAGSDPVSCFIGLHNGGAASPATTTTVDGSTVAETTIAAATAVGSGVTSFSGPTSTAVTGSRSSASVATTAAVATSSGATVSVAAGGSSLNVAGAIRAKGPIENGAGLVAAALALLL